MQQCRANTLALFQGISQEHLCHQAHPDFSPAGWHLGHIAYTEGLWILERLAGLPPQFPEYRQLFAADTLPKRDRIHLPSLTEIQHYLAAIRSQILPYLEALCLDPLPADCEPAPSQPTHFKLVSEPARLWHWLLQHESQHSETISLVLEMQRQGSLQRTVPAQPQAEEQVGWAASMVEIPASQFVMGYQGVEAIDNEGPAHTVDLPTYWIDRVPVTCGDYRRFIESGGYSDLRYWSKAGWRWLQRAQDAPNPICFPLYWQDNPQWDHHPVCGVSWYEAEAYATFVGKRLPSEAEWEKAASWNPATLAKSLYPWGNTAPTPARANYCHHIGHTSPVHAYAQGQSVYGCMDMLGNVWEWTHTWFEGYPGFAHYPYPGYSQAYFDQQHRVLKGGSWATRPWAMRTSFRNWYHPHVRQIFAGFRCAKDL
jgi:gamma-glutamyl hercynylcysteine S-oxide synthase